MNLVLKNVARSGDGEESHPYEHLASFHCQLFGQVAAPMEYVQTLTWTTQEHLWKKKEIMVLSLC